jgi:hypothetical protein
MPCQILLLIEHAHPVDALEKIRSWCKPVDGFAINQLTEVIGTILVVLHYLINI